MSFQAPTNNFFRLSKVSKKGDRYTYTIDEKFFDKDGRLVMSTDDRRHLAKVIRDHFVWVCGAALSYEQRKGFPKELLMLVNRKAFIGRSTKSRKYTRSARVKDITPFGVVQFIVVGTRSDFLLKLWERIERYTPVRTGFLKSQHKLMITGKHPGVSGDARSFRSGRARIVKFIKSRKVQRLLQRGFFLKFWNTAPYAQWLEKHGYTKSQGRAAFRSRPGIRSVAANKLKKALKIYNKSLGTYGKAALLLKQYVGEFDWKTKAEPRGPGYSKDISNEVFRVNLAAGKIWPIPTLIVWSRRRPNLRHITVTNDRHKKIIITKVKEKSQGPGI